MKEFHSIIKDYVEIKVFYDEETQSWKFQAITNFDFFPKVGENGVLKYSCLPSVEKLD